MTKDTLTYIEYVFIKTTEYLQGGAAAMRFNVKLFYFISKMICLYGTLWRHILKAIGFVTAGRLALFSTTDNEPRMCEEAD